MKRLPKNRNAVIILFVVLFLGELSAQVTEGYMDTVDTRFFKERYLHYEPAQYLEHYNDFAVFQIETVGSFSVPDPWLFSFHGYSYKWNKYYYNGHRMDDLFFPGHTLHKPRLYNHHMTISPLAAEIGFTYDPNAAPRFGVEYNRGGLGGVAPFTEDLVHLFHKTAEERTLVPIDDHRMIENAFSASGNYLVKSKDGNSYGQNFWLSAGRRMMTGFDYAGPAEYYPEDYFAFHHGGELPLISKKLFDSNGYLFSYLKRENLFTELYYGRSESAKLDAVNVSLFGRKRKADVRYNSGINFSFKQLIHNETEFERNILDQDGEGFEPWYPGQNFFEISLHHKQVNKLNENFDLSVELFESLGVFDPINEQFSNRLYYQSSPDSLIDLYIYEWQSNPFAGSLLENRFLLKYRTGNGSSLHFSASGGLTLDGFIVENNSLLKPNLELDAALTWQPVSFLKTALMAGRKPIPFDFDHVRFLSGDYLSGEVYFDNPARDFYTTTGGAYHSLTSGVRQPWILYIDLPFIFDLGRGNSIQWHNQYRLFNDLWTVDYKQNPEQIGHYETIEEEEIFFLDPGEVEYEVANADKEVMQEATGNDSYFFSSPFYGGSTISYERKGKKLFIKVSVTAYMVTGYGALGNGVLHNNIGMLSETMANPNTYINYVGRLDTDRSYLGKLFLSYRFNSKFSTLFQLNYRDGQPFSDFGLALEETEDGYLTALWNNNLMGDNPFTGEIAAREDGFFNTVLRARYEAGLSDDQKLAFNLSFYNIYDFGTELSEFVFPPIRDDGRFVLDMNIPRGLIFSVEYLF